MNRPIFDGHGPGNAQVMIIEDYPSEEEFANHSPMVGSNANLLGKMIKAAGYSLDLCYKTAYCKTKIPDHETQVAIRKLKTKIGSKEYKIYTEYFKAQEEHLLKEILEIKPSLILCCGELPLNFLCERQKIRKFRGSPLFLKDQILLQDTYFSRTIVIPILPPRDLFANELSKIFTQCDFTKAISILKNGFISPYKNTTISIGNTSSQLSDFLARYPNPEWGVFDIETYNGFITCIGFCLNSFEAISIPLLPKNIQEAVCLWKMVARLLLKNIGWVNQNIAYDYFFLNRLGIPPQRIIGDNMLLMHTCYPELPKSLDFQVSLFTNFEYYKDDVKEAVENKFSPEVLKETLYLYNAKDALTTYHTYEKLVEEAKDLKVWSFYKERVMPLFPMYRKTESYGIRIDESKRSSLEKKYSGMLMENLETLKEIVGDSVEDLNWNTFTNSPKQVAHLIYDVMECPKQYHWKENPKTGEREKVLSTDEETLEDLTLNRVKEGIIKNVIQLVLINRKLYRLVNYLQTPYHSDGRMYTSYNIVGTKSGRTSGGPSLWFSPQPSKDGKKLIKEPIGYSFQTIPKHGEELPDGTVIGKDLMEIFVADPGHVFIEGDKSQAEARIVCILSDDLDTLQYFDKPPGIHRLTASWIYNIDPFEIEKDTKEYNMGKRGRHAMNYDAGAYRLSTVAHISIREAEVVLYQLHNKSSKIRNVFHETIKKLIGPYSDRILVTPFNRRREFFSKIDEHYYKEGYSYIPQSTVSDDVKFSLRELTENNEWIKLLAEKHDSGLCMVKKDEKDKFAEEWFKYMEQPIDFRIGSIQRDISYVVPTELSIGECWGHMESLKR